jgi:hypothetical protein
MVSPEPLAYLYALEPFTPTNYRERLGDLRVQLLEKHLHNPHLAESLCLYRVECAGGLKPVV